MEQDLIQEVTETTAKNLSDSEKESIINKLSSMETLIKDGIADPNSFVHEMVFNSEKAIFQRWARTLEQLHYLGKYEKPLNTISTYIKKQIGKMENLSIDKKDNLYRNVSRSLDQKYKEQQELGGQNVSENTSAFYNLENSFLYKQIITLRNYHTEFANIIDELLKHFEHPEFGKQIYEDFESSMEWREIAILCSTLAELIEPVRKLQDESEKLDKALANFTTLQAIREDLNLRQSADTFRKCMMILRGDNMFRQMAHQFGISPRQNQRVRERLEDWPDKEVKRVIEKVLMSFMCKSCKCDIITGRKPVNPLDENFVKIRMNDLGLNDKLKIPKEFKIKLKTDQTITPIQIAEKTWGGQLKLVPV